jgi:hypothetical protein
MPACKTHVKSMAMVSPTAAVDLMQRINTFYELDVDAPHDARFPGGKAP